MASCNYSCAFSLWNCDDTDQDCQDGFIKLPCNHHICDSCFKICIDELIHSTQSEFECTFCGDKYKPHFKFKKVEYDESDDSNEDECEDIEGPNYEKVSVLTFNNKNTYGIGFNEDHDYEKSHANNNPSEDDDYDVKFADDYYDPENYENLYDENGCPNFDVSGDEGGYDDFDGCDDD